MSAPAETPPVGTKRFEAIEAFILVTFMVAALVGGTGAGAYYAWDKAVSIYYSLIATSPHKDGDLMTGYEVDRVTNVPTGARVVLEAHVPYEGADSSTVSYTLHIDRP